MWWLAVSLLLLCIIERGNLMDPSKISYFNIFALRTLLPFQSLTTGLLTKLQCSRSSPHMAPLACR